MNVRDELLAIRRRVGELTPQAVVDESRPANAPLHSEFEWDDTIAGESFRRQQASHLIRTVRVEYVAPTGESHSVRGFHSVIREDTRTTVYDPTDEIVLDPTRRRLLLGQMERDWLVFRRRWQHMEEFASLISGELNP